MNSIEQQIKEEDDLCDESKVLKEGEKISIFTYGSPKEIVISKEKITIFPSRNMYVWNYEHLIKSVSSTPVKTRMTRARKKVETKLRTGI